MQQDDELRPVASLDAQNSADEMVKAIRLKKKDAEQVRIALGQTLNHTRYALTERKYQGVITLTWFKSEQSRMSEQLKAANAELRRRGSTKLYLSRSATIQKHTVQGAIARLRSWMQWNDAWIYDERPTGNLCRSFTLPERFQNTDRLPFLPQKQLAAVFRKIRRTDSSDSDNMRGDSDEEPAEQQPNEADPDCPEASNPFDESDAGDPEDSDDAFSNNDHRPLVIHDDVPRCSNDVSTSGDSE